MRATVFALLAVLAGCPAGKPAPAEVPPEATAAPVTIALVGTSDLHGHVERLPILAGYLANLRAARARDGGGVVLIDAGDMFQGTLESNSAEGAPVILAYNHLGYDAAAIGNHEFDYGPVGPADTTTGQEDPRGALRARARQARFPLLMANVLDAATGAPPAWDNVVPSTAIDVAGVRVGIVGVTTMSTPRTTLTANVRGLAMKPIADAITAEAARLRQGGAQLVVVAAHAGSKCTDFTDPDDTSSCERDDEIFEVARALAPGTVSAIVAGHTHQAVAHRVNGIAIVQSYSYGRAFGRVDLVVEGGAVTIARVHPPQDLCREKDPPCETFEYEGGDVTPSAAVAKLLEPTFAAVEARKRERLGVTLTADVRRAYAEESALGNLFADLMLAARPDADVAVTNGGGLRADLPAGELTYGQLYEAMPFDNRLAFVRLDAGQLGRMFAVNLGRSSGLLSLAGLVASARCDGGRLVVSLRRPGGKAVPEDERLTMVTNSYLASGGDGLFADLGITDADITEDPGLTVRDEMAAVLRARGAHIDPATLYRPGALRLTYPGERPVRCP